MVIENLKDIAPERRCFRLVGGVLVERTVKDVLPALTSNRDQVYYVNMCIVCDHYATKYQSFLPFLPTMILFMVF
jgi:prefoldin subunit 2